MIRITNAGYQILFLSTGKLPQKPNIILAEQAEVINLIKQHSNAFDAHTKCEAGVFVGIDIAILQHFRMYHTAT